MAHAELMLDAHGAYRWVAFWDDAPNEVSKEAFSTAEEAYAASLSLPLTVVPTVREDEGREISYEDAMALLNVTDNG